MMRALAAEFTKLKRSRMVLLTVVAVLAYAAIDLALGPYVSSPEGMEMIAEQGGAFAQAVEMGLYEPTWENYLVMTPQMIAGGLALLLFALVAAYMFGREYKEGTAPQTLSTPVRREFVVLSKMIVLGVWILALGLLMLAVHLVDMAILGFDGFAWTLVFETLGETLIVTFMLYLTMPVFAWFAVWGRGYLRPMLAAIVLMGVGNGLLVDDISRFYPWNMPVHQVGASWMPIPPSELVVGSWVVLAIVFALGLAATVWQVNHADVVA